MNFFDTEKTNDNVGRRNDFRSYVLIDGKLQPFCLSFSNFRASKEHDEDGYYLTTYHKKDNVKDSIISGVDDRECPKEVLLDIEINDEYFISIDGYLCDHKNYKKTKQKSYLKDIMVSKNKNNVRYDQIPSFFTMYFSHRNSSQNVLYLTVEEFNRYQKQLSNFDYSGGRAGLTSQNKYVSHSVQRSYFDETDVAVRSYGRQYDILIKDRYYENRHFYDTDLETNEVNNYFNPSKKRVKIAYALAENLFFDEDGYLCHMDMYKLISKKDEERERDIILFLL